MKAVVSLALTMLAVPPVCSAKAYSISIMRDGTNAVFVFNGSPCSPHHISDTLDRLSTIGGTNIPVNVRVDAAATAADLAQALHIIQQTGFHNAVLIAPGVQDGQAGSYQLSLDCAKRSIGGDIAGSLVESGFHPSDERQEIRKPHGSQEPRDSGTPAGPRPRAVYFAGPEREFSAEDLQAHPEVTVVDSFDQVKRLAVRGVPIWISLSMAKQVDMKWFRSLPQKYLPLVLVGCNNSLYAFRETLFTGFIDGPYVDWSNRSLGPGFSAWMLKADDETGSSAFSRGYREDPTVDGILKVTDILFSFSKWHSL